jgi:hypothetical protein
MSKENINGGRNGWQRKVCLPHGSEEAKRGRKGLESQYALQWHT